MTTFCARAAGALALAAMLTACKDADEADGASYMDASEEAVEVREGEFPRLAALAAEPLPPIPAGAPRSPGTTEYLDTAPVSDETDDWDDDWGDEMAEADEAAEDMGEMAPADPAPAAPTQTPDPAPVQRRVESKVDLCVETPFPYQYVVAVGFFDQGRDDWRSVGWYNLEQGKCAGFTLPGAIEEIYLHGRFNRRLESSGDAATDFFTGMIVLGDPDTMGRVEGGTRFCVNDDAFDVEGRLRCSGRGYRGEGFRRVPIAPGYETVIELYEGGSIGGGLAR